MPVAFSPPPFPFSDVVPPSASDNGAADAAPPADAFAQVLLAAGLDPARIPAKDTSVADARGRILRRGRDIVDSKADAPTASAPRPGTDAAAVIGASKKEDALAVVAATVSTTPTDAVADPTALSAALTAAMASTATPKVEAATQTATAPASDVAGARRESVRVNAAANSDRGERLDIGAGTPETTTVATSAAANTRASDVLLAAAAGRDISATVALKARETAQSADSAASGIATLQAPAPTPHAAATIPANTIETPIGAPGWADEFAGKLGQVVMLRNDRAEFHLHPAELGPIDVRITFASDQAVVLIHATHQATRDALEQALPHLRDMLAGQGIALGQANVQGERNQADAEAFQRGSGRSGEAFGAPDLAVRTIQLRGLVDVFA